jgi:hypothetical protein
MPERSLFMCVRQTISWKEARSLLKLGNPAEYYRCFKSQERRLCKGGLNHSHKDAFVKVEIFSPCKDNPIMLHGGAFIEFTDNNTAYFMSACCCGGCTCGQHNHI